MDVFRAIADPVRRELVEQIASRPRRVVDLAQAREISRPAVSKHLKVMVEAGIVSAEDRGRERWYALRPEALEEIEAWLRRVRATPPVPEHALDALDLEVRRTERERRSTTSSDRPNRRPGENTA
ncbi:ArsR/SmtB family transcription factor [Georgenia deserti]|uniref:ArsR/SmtB family transcription factor n=1 Tax=Georgenia deserti TaxID=2093781 RepID=A0ABW4L7C9_9MICO